jgi:hypothetical protein
MSPLDSPPRLGPAVYARAVDEAEGRLRELREVEWEDLTLGALALGLAVAATQVRESLALPLFFGGVMLWALGLRALWRRWDLVDRLSGERDAYVIPEVLAYASREASMSRRRTYAALIRSRVRDSASDSSSVVGPVAAELAALISDLEDPELELEPACAVECSRMLSDLAESPLLNPALGAEELRSRVRQIEAGFHRAQHPRELDRIGR